MKLIVCLIIGFNAFSIVSFGQEKQQNKKGSTYKYSEKAVTVENNKIVEEKAIFEDDEKKSVEKNSESLLHKLKMCESRIGHSKDSNTSEELNKEYNELRKDFIAYVQVSGLENLTEPEKSKYMLLMKQEGNVEEYTSAKKSLGK